MAGGPGSKGERLYDWRCLRPAAALTC